MLDRIKEIVTVFYYGGRDWGIAIIDNSVVIWHDIWQQMWQINKSLYKNIHDPLALKSGQEKLKGFIFCLIRNSSMHSGEGNIQDSFNFVHEQECLCDIFFYLFQAGKY